MPHTRFQQELLCAESPPAGRHRAGQLADRIMWVQIKIWLLVWIIQPWKEFQGEITEVLQPPLFERQLFVWWLNAVLPMGKKMHDTLLLVHWCVLLRLSSITIPENTTERLSRKQPRESSHFMLKSFFPFVVFCLVFFSSEPGAFWRFSSQDFGIPNALRENEVWVCCGQVSEIVPVVLAG